MHVQEREAEAARLEAREVRAAVEPGKGGRRAGDGDLRELARRDRNAPYLTQPRDLASVVEERLPLAVARGVGEEQVVACRQVRVDRLDPAQVVVHLLDGRQVETAPPPGGQGGVGLGAGPGRRGWRCSRSPAAAGPCPSPESGGR